jgi:hypothetical protein
MMKWLFRLMFPCQLNDSDFMQLMPVAGPPGISPLPPTLASATTVAPTTFLTFISGTTAIATITPPLTGAHLLMMIFTNATPTAFTTTGNIKAVATPAQNLPVFLMYNPVEAKYYASVTKAS